MHKFFAVNRRFVYILVLLLSLSSFLLAQNNFHKPPLAVLLNIKGAIGPATSDYIEYGFKKAKEKRAHVVILQLDTPGGLSTSMREIIKTMLASPIPVIAYVAPSGARAASAGTYILYAAQIAAMAPGTNLGAATPVKVGGVMGQKKEKNTKPSPEEIKALNDARAYIRSLAELHGRNAKWAEKAVQKGESLSAPQALKLQVINLIAKDIPGLLQQTNGQKVLVQKTEIKLQTTHAIILTINPSWRSNFLSVITNPTFAYILLMIGIYGIFFEFYSPGYVAPGVIGGICLLIGLYALALLPINYVGLALLLLGIALIIAEAFTTSFGILGIGGAISFVLGSIFLMKTDNIYFQISIYAIVIVTALTLLFVLLVLGMLIRSRRSPPVSGVNVLIGQRSVVEIDSSGKLWVRLEGEHWQCRSTAPVKNGQQVLVKKIEGLILEVEPVLNEDED